MPIHIKVNHQREGNIVKIASNGISFKWTADFSATIIQSRRQQNDIFNNFEIYIANKIVVSLEFSI